VQEPPEREPPGPDRPASIRPRPVQHHVVVVVPADHDHWRYLDQPGRRRIDRQRLVIRAGAGVIEEVTGVTMASG